MYFFPGRVERGPGWALRVRPDPDPVPDPQGPALAQDGPILGPEGPFGDTVGGAIWTYVFFRKWKVNTPPLNPVLKI